MTKNMRTWTDRGFT